MAPQTLPPAGGELAAQQHDAVPDADYFNIALQGVFPPRGRSVLRPASRGRPRVSRRAVREHARPRSSRSSPGTTPRSAAFVEHQFSAQDAHYRANYPGATLDVVEVDGEPRGAALRPPRASDIRIMDIAMAPAFRGRGIGTGLLEGLIAEARSSGRSLSSTWRGRTRRARCTSGSASSRRASTACTS